jgi:hypothetical protein
MYVYAVVHPNDKVGRGNNTYEIFGVFTVLVSTGHRLSCLGDFLVFYQSFKETAGIMP